MKKTILSFWLLCGTLFINADDTGDRTLITASEKAWAETFYRKNIQLNLSKADEERIEELIEHIHNGCSALQYNEKKVLHVLINLTEQHINTYFFLKSESSTNKMLLYVRSLLIGSGSAIWLTYLYTSWKSHYATIEYNKHPYSYDRIETSLPGQLLWSSLCVALATIHIFSGVDGVLDLLYADLYFEKYCFVKTSLMRYAESLE
jgi:hypothetical protein